MIWLVAWFYALLDNYLMIIYALPSDQQNKKTKFRGPYSAGEL
jgi:hypothetical protein